jgi:hypothetical protein
VLLCGAAVILHTTLDPHTSRIKLRAHAHPTDRSRRGVEDLDPDTIAALLPHPPAHYSGNGFVALSVVTADTLKTEATAHLVALREEADRLRAELSRMHAQLEEQHDQIGDLTRLVAGSSTAHDKEAPLAKASIAIHMLRETLAKRDQQINALSFKQSHPELQPAPNVGKPGSHPIIRSETSARTATPTAPSPTTISIPTAPPTASPTTIKVTDGVPNAVYLYTSQKGTFERKRCDVPCFVRDKQQAIYHTVRSLNDSVFCVTRTMEVEREGEHRRCLTSSTSFASDFPMTYYTPSFRNIFKKAPGFDDRTEAAVFVARNCHSNNHREKIVKRLEQHFRVDSPSTCLHNTNSSFSKDKVVGLQKYRIYLAFENSIVKDYVTEKVYDGLEAGAVPVYLGAPNIEDGFVPTGSIVNAAAFASTDSLAEYIKVLLRDKTAWNMHQEWRTRAPDNKFVARFNKTKVDVDCRICRAVSKNFQSQ